MVHNLIRPLLIHPKVREVLRGFPTDIKDKVGQSLLALQQGYRLTLPKSRPMSEIGMGVEELRTRGRDGIFRVFYYTKDRRGILVFHAFMKKSKKTPELEIELGKRRLREMLNETK